MAKSLHKELTLKAEKEKEPVKYRRLQEFEIEREGWKSVPDFTKHMIKEYKITSTGAEITANWVHFRIDERKLPQSLGGNIIDVAMFGNVKFVRLSDKVYEPKSKGRKPGSKNKAKVITGGKKVLLQHLRKGDHIS